MDTGRVQGGWVACRFGRLAPRGLRGKHHRERIQEPIKGRWRPKAAAPLL